MDINFGLTNYQQKKMNWGNFTKVKIIGTNIKKNQTCLLISKKGYGCIYKTNITLKDTNERKGIVF
jgi:hypothetical protein